MSFSRENHFYQSMPVSSNRMKLNGNNKSVASHEVELTPVKMGSSSTNPIVNTEEFAKLDALLEDLLAEVDQPIFLTKNLNGNLKQKEEIIEDIDDLERSVEWLAEQKKLLKLKKEAESKVNGQTPYQSIKDKLELLSAPTSNQESHNASLKKKYGFSYTNPSSLNKLNNASTQNDQNGSDQDDIMNINEDYKVTNGNGYVNNKPPVSPNIRTIVINGNNSYPNGQHTHFRSLSTNPHMLKHINESEDENLSTEPIDSNGVNDIFARYQNRSFRSHTLQKRSKYHVVSNDYTDATRPSAPTPLPMHTQSLHRSSFLTKRACSAPPAELLGKQVMLQRMELKSPLTVRQTPALTFEQQDQNQAVVPMQYHHQQPKTNGSSTLPHRCQTPLVLNGSNRPLNIGGGAAYYTSINPYGTTSRAPMHKSNSLNRNGGGRNDHAIPSQDLSVEAMSYQPPPSRNVFLNRAYSETPRVNTFTNGYETDSGVTSNPSYNNNSGVNFNSYRTLGPQQGRFNNTSVGENNDNENSLLKLRQVLDINKRPASANSLGHFQNMTASNGYNIRGNSTSISNRTDPSTNLNQRPRDKMFNGIEQKNLEVEANNDLVSNQFVQAQIDSTIQYIDGNGNLSNGVPAFISADGRQIILKDNSPNEELPPNHQICRSPSVTNAFPQQINGYGTYNKNNLTDLNRMISSGSGSTLERQGRRDEPFAKITSNSSLPESSAEVIRQHPKSVKTNQLYWYKPKISREEAINLLKDKHPGTFLIRDSNNFPGAYGLALKVDRPPPNVQIKPGADPTNELVRHFLIEPTTKGVRIKGCCNEPVFGTLAALVYQHSLTPLALPCKLILPTNDLTQSSSSSNSSISTQKSLQNSSSDGSSKRSVANKVQKQASVNSQIKDNSYLLERGAACNVYYLNSVSLDNRNGLDAINYALTNSKAFVTKDASQLLLVQFKVTATGITVTDINRKKFSKLHFPIITVVYCAVDEKLTWPQRIDKIAHPRIFGLICRPRVNNGPNEVHLFVELDPDQPAIAIVDFINRYLIPSKQSLKE